MSTLEIRNKMWDIVEMPKGKKKPLMVANGFLLTNAS